MGEIADMMLEGDLCAGCGGYLEGDGEGIPRYCSDDCGPSFKISTEPDRVRCPQCNRKVKAIGLQQHIADAHSKSKAAKSKQSAPKNLRDELAMVALAGLLGNAEWFRGAMQNVKFLQITADEYFSKAAYTLADAMLEARKQ